MRQVKLPEPFAGVGEYGLCESPLVFESESSPECDDRSVEELINEGEIEDPDFSGRKLNCRIRDPAYRDWTGR